jgi:hypothetical protein
MQFNFVVSTNEGAVRLWKSLGFEVVGILPGAFAHPEKGDVDAVVMFRKFIASKFTPHRPMEPVSTVSRGMSQISMLPKSRHEQLSYQQQYHREAQYR